MRSARASVRWDVVACSALFLLCACGRIGYDGIGDPPMSDAFLLPPDAGAADDAVSPRSDVSEDRPVASGDGTGADELGAGEDASTSDQDAVSSDAAACGSGPVALLHWNVAPGATVSAMDLEFKVTNRSGRTIPMSSLKLRYYLTSEISAARLQTYYTEVCCSAPRPRFDSSVLLALQAIAAPTPTATSYIEVGFDVGAGTLVDGDTVKVEIGLGGNGNETQSNDYSYLPAASGTQAQWDRCPSAPGNQACAKYVSCVTTVFIDGALAWGTPP
jgi:hypothetical protein